MSLDSPAVFTIVLNYRHVDDTLRCISSVRRSTYRDQRLVVVDNGSTDETTGRLRRSLPSTTLISSPDNLGYAGGNNLGIRHALDREADLVWLLNPDVVVEPEALERMVMTATERPEAGIVGGRILYAGTRPRKIWFNGGNIDWLRAAATSHRDDGARDSDVPAGEPFAVDYVTGASMVVRREVFSDIGLLPEEYFLYYEETEFNVRAREAGWEILVDSRARMAHDKRSTSRLPAPYYVYYFVRNRLAFSIAHTDRSIDEVDAELETWVQAWRRKVGDREPGWLPAYEGLVATARKDARAGVLGKRDDIDDIVATALESHSRER